MKTTLRRRAVAALLLGLAAGCGRSVVQPEMEPSFGRAGTPGVPDGVWPGPDTSNIHTGYFGSGHTPRASTDVIDPG
jgi:hypothetical protein